jgi:ABC-type antimicrobial peptide transport system permease subunit
VAVFLSASGLYGMMAFVVAQRRREFALRLVLGDRPAGVLKLVIRSMFRLTATGIAVGVVPAILLSVALRRQFPGIVTLDPGAALITIAALVSAGLIASCVPCVAAMRVSPGLLLRDME